MFSQNACLAMLISAFLFCFSINSNLYSQAYQNNPPLKINVTMISSETGFSDLEISVIKIFKDVLTKNGLFSENENQVEWLLNVNRTTEENKIILSVVEMQVVPNEVVEVGKKSEVFYSLLNDEQKAKLTAEGKLIREYVSSEYMKQFRMILDDHLEIIDISELGSFSQKIAGRYL